MLEFEGNITSSAPKQSGNQVVRNAQDSDIEACVLLGRELHADATVALMMFDREKINRLAKGWVTSGSYNVLVAEETGVSRHAAKRLSGKYQADHSGLTANRLQFG